VAVMATWVEESEQAGTALPKVRMLADFTADRRQTIKALLDVPKVIGEQEELFKQIQERGAAVEKFQFEVIWDLSEIAAEIMRLSAARPESQFVTVGLIDDLFTLKDGEREMVATEALRAGITFNGLVYNKTALGKFFLGTINTVAMRTRGKSLHAADFLAAQTGGEVARVGRADDLADGLERFISNLSARYSLGFRIEENERDDGRMHKLEVKVKADDGHKKRRKIVVHARRGYYSPKS
jgi:hypothetical protein